MAFGIINISLNLDKKLKQTKIAKKDKKNKKTVCVNHNKELVDIAVQADEVIAPIDTSD